MRPWLLLLAKSLTTGKSRLAPLLDDAARVRLNRFLFRHTLAVAHRFSGRERTAVVSNCPSTLALAAAHGFRAIEQASDCGLSGAARQGVEALGLDGAERILLLACDMPALRAGDLRAVTAREHEVVLCPDKNETGTNGLLVPAALPMQFQFGPHSLQKHCAEVARLGYAPKLHRNPRIALDIDTARDVQRWFRQYPDQVAQARITFLEEGALQCA